MPEIFDTLRGLLLRSNELLRALHPSSASRIQGRISEHSPDFRHD
jgi:hypothetical protein